MSARIAIAGHQGLGQTTRSLVRQGIRKYLASKQILGIASLAEGADQIFAEEVIKAGGSLIVVLPCRLYEGTFKDVTALASFQNLLAHANEVSMLDFDRPSEEAFWAAGRAVVDLADRVVAVWDGLPAVGLGGTADVVRYAKQHGKPVKVIWPSGASRS